MARWVGIYGANLQTSSTPMFTKPQTDHHITEILLWCTAMTSFTASQTNPLPIPLHPPPNHNFNLSFLTLPWMTPTRLVFASSIFPFTHAVDPTLGVDEGSGADGCD